jgi:hypothetical protein
MQDGTGILNQLCIGYSLRPRLSSRLTLGGRTLPRKPWVCGGPDSNRAYRYLCLHSHFRPVHGRLPLPLRPCRNAFLPLPGEGKSMTSVCRLSPDHFRRGSTRWVSCYALFKWWLPLSQHPHCLSRSTSFSTERHLGTLIDGLGCFPLDDGAYPPPSDCRASPCGIRSLIEFSTQVWALAHSVLYLRRSAPDAIPKYISERTSYHGV